MASRNTNTRTQQAPRFQNQDFNETRTSAPLKPKYQEQRQGGEEQRSRQPRYQGQNQSVEGQPRYQGQQPRYEGQPRYQGQQPRYQGQQPRYNDEQRQQFKPRYQESRQYDNKESSFEDLVNQNYQISQQIKKLGGNKRSNEIAMNYITMNIYSTMLETSASGKELADLVCQFPSAPEYDPTNVEEYKTKCTILYFKNYIYNFVDKRNNVTFKTLANQGLNNVRNLINDHLECLSLGNQGDARFCIVFDGKITFTREQLTQFYKFGFSVYREYSDEDRFSKYNKPTSANESNANVSQDVESDDDISDSDDEITDSDDE